jgi:hypothetical protein
MIEVRPADLLDVGAAKPDLSSWSKDSSEFREEWQELRAQLEVLDHVLAHDASEAVRPPREPAGSEIDVVIATAYVDVQPTGHPPRARTQVNPRITRNDVLVSESLQARPDSLKIEPHRAKRGVREGEVSQ